MKKIIKIIAVLLVLAGGYYAYQSFTKDEGVKAPMVQRNLAQAETVDIRQVIDQSGEVIPALATEVKSEVNGSIQKLLVEEGDTVARGQELMLLDIKTLETEYTEAKRRVDAAQLRLDKAERQYQRLLKLDAGNHTAKHEVEDALTDRDLAQIELDIQQARMDAVSEEISKSTIRAPHDGMVLNLDLTEGAVITGASSVNNGSILMLIAQMTKLEIETKFSELDINRISLGTKAMVSFDAIPGEAFEANIIRIAPNARNENNQRFFPVVLEMVQTDERIKPGIAATVEIIKEEAVGVVGVLISAVFRDGKEEYVYLKNGDDFERVTVVSGIRNSQHVEIKEGLKEGDTVSLIHPSPDKRPPSGKPSWVGNK